MRMRLNYGLLFALTLVVMPGARSQCIPIVCSLTFQLQSNASGIALGASGSNYATAAFGTIQAYGGATPLGVTKTMSASSMTISTPFNVYVTCYNLLSLIPCTLLVSPGYVLTAQLQSTDMVNAWKIGSSILSSASATTLTSSGVYASATAYTLGLTIPFSERAGTVSNSINFVAIAN